MLVKADYEEGQALKIRGTPTYILNGKVVPGAQTYESLLEVLSAAL